MNSNRKILKEEKPKRTGGASHKIPKRAISDIHIARARWKLSCKNCVYANFCAAQPTLRAYVQGVAQKDISDLKNNVNWRDDLPTNVLNKKK